MQVSAARLLLAVLIFLGLPLASVVIAPSVSESAVWENKYNWDENTEVHYRKWVLSKWNKNFFNQPGPFQGIPVDCADTVYAMRLAYAATYGLPFAIKDPTGGGGVISNNTTRFDKYPEGERVRRFMIYLRDVVSTASLPADTYPAAVRRDAITSGSLILTGRSNHHSWTVQHVSKTGIPFLLFSSRPAKTTLFERYEYPSKEFIFVDGFAPETNAGFRNFRKPHELNRPVFEAEGFSLEQYQLPFKSWSKHMQARLQLTDESPSERVTRVLGEACRAAKERVESVNEGLRTLGSLNQRCMTAQQYDDYSTPSRDKRLKANFEEVLAVYKSDYNKVGSEDRAALDTVVKASNASYGYCPVKISRSQSLSLGQIYMASMRGRLSSDPHDSLAARWGLERSAGIAESCGLK